MSYDTNQQFAKKVKTNYWSVITSSTPLCHIFLNEDCVAFYHTIQIVLSSEVLMQMVNHCLMKRSELFPPETVKIFRAWNLSIWHFLKIHIKIYLTLLICLLFYSLRCVLYWSQPLCISIVINWVVE